MKISKRLISILLTFVMIFAGIMVIHAEEIITDNIKLFEPIEINNGDVASDTLVPMAANSCPLNADDFFDNPQLFASYTPTDLYWALQESYTVLPLSGGSLAGLDFLNGGGFKINWGGDKILQYHPETSPHHGGAYYKLSSGVFGTKRYDLKGNPL